MVLDKIISATADAASSAYQGISNAAAKGAEYGGQAVNLVGSSAKDGVLRELGEFLFEPGILGWRLGDKVAEHYELENTGTAVKVASAGVGMAIAYHGKPAQVIRSLAVSAGVNFMIPKIKQTLDHIANPPTPEDAKPLKLHINEAALRKQEESYRE